MSRSLLAMLLLALALLSAAAPGVAADRAGAWRQAAPEYVPAFPRSKRAQAVWAADRCWRECGAYTAWDLVACLQYDSQGRCLKHTDAADRACQRDCRIWGGPLLPLEFPWD
jgi:hypothetical protein